MWFSVALMKFHWSGINWHVFNQSECRNCCWYIIIQKIAPQAKSGKYFQIWFPLPPPPPRFTGENGGVLSMRMQVILDSLFARPGSAPIWDWSNCYCASLVRMLYMTWRVPRHVFQARAPSRNSTKYRADDLCGNLICEYFCWMLGDPHCFSADHFLWFFPLY